MRGIERGHGFSPGSVSRQGFPAPQITLPGFFSRGDQMSQQKVFCQNVAMQSVQSDDVGAVADWIAIILPIIAALPCFQPKTAAERQQWIAEHPVQARNQAIRTLREKSPDRMRRRDARPIAQGMVEEAISMSADEFAKLCGE